MDGNSKPAYYVGLPVSVSFDCFLPLIICIQCLFMMTLNHTVCSIILICTCKPILAMDYGTICKSAMATIACNNAYDQYLHIFQSIQHVQYALKGCKLYNLALLTCQSQSTSPQRADEVSLICTTTATTLLPISLYRDATFYILSMGYMVEVQTELCKVSLLVKSQLQS